MKHYLLLAAFALALAAPAAAQQRPPAQVPAAAKATFKARFPTVKTATWEKEGDKLEAGFQLNGRTMSALLTPAGELLETETAIAPGQLPAPVRGKLARDYPACRVHEAAAIVRADGSTIYEAEVARGGKSQDLLFHADGTRVSK